MKLLDMARNRMRHVYVARDSLGMDSRRAGWGHVPAYERKITLGHHNYNSDGNLLNCLMKSHILHNQDEKTTQSIVHTQ